MNDDIGVMAKFSAFCKVAMFVPVTAALMLVVSVMVISIYIAAYGFTLAGFALIIAGLIAFDYWFFLVGFALAAFGGAVYHEFFVSPLGDLVPLTQVPRYVYERLNTITPL